MTAGGSRSFEKLGQFLAHFNSLPLRALTDVRSGDRSSALGADVIVLRECGTAVKAWLQIGHVFQECTAFAEGFCVFQRQVSSKGDDPGEERIAFPIVAPRQCPAAPSVVLFALYVLLLRSRERRLLGRDDEDVRAIGAARRPVANPGSGLLAVLNGQAVAKRTAIALFRRGVVADGVAFEA